MLITNKGEKMRKVKIVVELETNLPEESLENLETSLQYNLESFFEDEVAAQEDNEEDDFECDIESIEVKY